MAQKEKRISLDRSKLLGFRLDAAGATQVAGTRFAARLGAKFGTKLGGKVGQKA